MKKLMFITLVALSGSNLFGRFIAPEYQECLQKAGTITDEVERNKAIQDCSSPRTSGSTGKLYMNPELSKCLEDKGTSPTNMNMKNIKTKADYEACYLLHGPDEGEVSSGTGEGGLYY